MISYEKLWKAMKERGVTRLKRNESVSTHTIEMFCKILNCDVGEIMQYIPDETNDL